MLSMFKKKSASPSPNKSSPMSSPSAKSSKKKKKNRKAKSSSSSSNNTTGLDLPPGWNCTKGKREEEDDCWHPSMPREEQVFCGIGWVEGGEAGAETFMRRYAEMGPAGIKVEFKQEIENYKSPKPEHTAFDANPDKNKDNALIACLDDSRVLLSDKKYINASLTSDLKKLNRKYILTQVPLESTIASFWQMIYEQESCFCAFVLAPELSKENAYKPTAPFWPTQEKETQKYGKFTVTNNKDDCCHEYDCGMEMHWHQLEIVRRGSPDKTKSIRIGYIYQWAPDFTVDRASGIIDIMRQMSKGFWVNTNATVILMDEFSGTGNAASFMIVDAVRELLHNGENEIKLPSIVQWARRCRANAIRTEEEYLEVVKTIGLYLSRYGNSHVNKKIFEEYYKKICGAESEQKK